MPRLPRSAPDSNGPTKPSLVESLRRATHQPTRQSRGQKPYSRKMLHLPTHGPQLGSPSSHDHFMTYVHVSEVIRKYQASHECYPYHAQPEYYPYESPIASDHIWERGPGAAYPTSPASTSTSFESPQPCSSFAPSPGVDCWDPATTFEDSYLLQENIQTGLEEASSFTTTFDLRDFESLSIERNRDSEIASRPLTDEEIGEIAAYLEDPTMLTTLRYLQIKVHATTSELDDIANVLS
ncbi:hypothetical protein BDN70DRAFT_195389 [Pholiota conissans]|uniref:Uncharacterized protein n=1 Tax=Pholiota conissans TaxID=109636 RepID=A0A9P6D5H9_9AGAR|nr:hypothetical protein BDN70DRAFT_195389 [Pholiota conissans]